MKFLYDLFPLLLFFAAFKAYDIYTASAVAIVASFVQVGGYWLKHRRFETMHLITLAIIVVFGGLTIALHDDTFIKWKPTLVYWVLGGLVLGSQWFGKKTAVERMLGNQLTLPAAVWARQNISWGLFFLVLGTLNLYVAFYFRLDLDAETRQNIWVNFKVFGLLGLTFIFMLAQGMLLARHLPDKPGKQTDRTS
ncbi:MAG: septation protein A [Gammaproteobacteria bacterium]|nr:septation protein A [Gammaproteobacteria bacterium]